MEIFIKFPHYGNFLLHKGGNYLWKYGIWKFSLMFCCNTVSTEKLSYLLGHEFTLRKDVALFPTKSIQWTLVRITAWLAFICTYIRWFMFCAVCIAAKFFSIDPNEDQRRWLSALIRNACTLKSTEVVRCWKKTKKWPFFLL